VRCFWSQVTLTRSLPSAQDSGLIRGFSWFTTVQHCLDRPFASPVPISGIGCIWFSAVHFFEADSSAYFADAVYTAPALSPSMPWLDTAVPSFAWVLRQRLMSVFAHCRFQQRRKELLAAAAPAALSPGLRARTLACGRGRCMPPLLPVRGT
jgi:hypothetical protein